MGGTIVNVIMDLQERQREKQIKYERRILRELSLEQVKKRFVQYFDKGYIDVVEEGCLDIAIEAFLLGAHYSKFGYYGESEEEVRARCFQEEKYLVDTLFHFIRYWGKIGSNENFEEGLYYRCEGYVEAWWKDGFKTGEKRHKMKLH
ncbi:hypothetical protein BAOM_0173 [Peribacillus asahii]|uniref:DUF2521 family protein n=1 Tax=Peribacillus asahii TaxID=228899 RepID=A0A3Q9RJQ6_9BACI|nr:hypothetical protein BAOM_0173 [Peribacillus asahii]